MSSSTANLAQAGKQPENVASKVHMEEHMMSLDELSSHYKVKVDPKKPQLSIGLSPETAQEQLKIFGPNIMTPPKQTPLILQYLHSLSNMFNMLLILAGILCFIIVIIQPSETTNIYIGAILILVAMLNALIEFVQDQKSKAILKSFLNMVPRKCMIVRNGQLVSAEASTLVPGEVVCVRMGDKLPADVCLFHCSEFKVDNSSLTGEADPQERKPTNTHTNPLEATNMAFNGTLAVNGEAFGIVVRTGDQTVLGQIANMAGSEKKRDSPLTQEIEIFVRRIAAIAIFSSIVFFVYGIRNGNGLPPTINFAIGVFVSFVPEGLPATMTLLLTVAAKRMGKLNVLVKDLRGVETLGSITCLATDKTGTLTRNQMTVTYVWSGSKMYDATVADSSSRKSQVALDIAPQSKSNDVAMKPLPAQAPTETFPKFQLAIPELNEMAHIAYLCSKAQFDRVDIPLKERNIVADATETGLFSFSANQLPNSDTTRERFPKVFEIPFNSTNKWAMTIHEKPHETGVYTLYIKGAPERVFALCTSFINAENKTVPLVDVHKAAYEKAYETMASKGHRVIGCACLHLPSDKYPRGYTFKKELTDAEKEGDMTRMGVYPASDYTFMGLYSLEDPPKHGVREAIGKCRQAGIKVMMVTGDHPLTAEAIGRKINLMLQETKEMLAKRTNRALSTIQYHEYNAIVIHGEKIDSLTDEDWENILSKDEIIFARTSPKHKLQIVKRCQARGHIVGVTGDGVNDSPALKKADLGIAMNISGSDVSKEAATMILLDDNFASTVNGISEGRLIFQNLRKSVRYTITHLTPEIISAFLYLIVPLPLPLGAIQIILVDLGFELFVSSAYAWELPESGRDALMTSLPRKPVNVRTIDFLRRQNAVDEKKRAAIHKFASLAPDSVEEGLSLGKKLMLFLGAVIYHVKSLFDKKLWSMYFEHKDGQILVDAKTLSYGFLEVGVIETVGCFVAFFFAYFYEYGLGLAGVQALKQADSDDYRQKLAYTQSVYFSALLIQQTFNHFMCKVENKLPFGMTMIQNKATWIALFMGFCFGAIVVYAPGGPVPFGTTRISPLHFLIPIGFGALVMVYGSLRILYFRRKLAVNQYLTLPLDLHPTRFSTKSLNA